MAIRKKGRRPFNFNGRDFVWWVENELFMHVASVDKKFSVVFELIGSKPIMFVAGPEFPGVDPTWERPVPIVPPEFNEKSSTPGLVRELLEWSLDPAHEVTLYRGPGGHALERMWAELGQGDDARSEAAEAARHFYAGKGLLMRGDIPAGFESFNKALELDGQFSTYVDIATILQQFGEAGSLPFAARAYELKPQNSDAAMVYARALSQEGDRDRCESVLRKILARDATYGPAKEMITRMVTPSPSLETRVIDTELAGRPLRTKEVDGGWAWKWGEWESAAFSYLEYRPWTPQVIGDRLCFSTFDSAAWRVVWGDDVGPPFDDAYDTASASERPVYIARRGGQHFLVRGNTERSAMYEQQVFFRVDDDEVTIRVGRAPSPWVPVDWLPMEGRAVGSDVGVNDPSTEGPHNE